MKSADRKPFWNRYARLYDRIIRKDADAYRRAGELMEPDLKPYMRVLELATGTGIVALRIAPLVASVEATDFSSEMITAAQKKPTPGNVRFSVEDATSLTFPDDAFDAVVIQNALHILPEPEKALAEIRRVLRPEGILIAPTFAHNGGFKERLLSRLMSLSGFRAYHKWTPEGFLRFLEQNGFSVARRETIHASFPLVYTSAHVKRSEHGHKDT